VCDTSTNSTYTICCGFDVQQTVQLIPSKSKVHSKSKQWSLDFDKLWTYHGVVANHSELLYHKTTMSLYVIAKMDVIDENVNNKQYLQLSIASLTDAYYNEMTLWDRNVNATAEEKELAWLCCRLHSTLLQVRHV